MKFHVCFGAKIVKHASSLSINDLHNNTIVHVATQTVTFPDRLISPITRVKKINELFLTVRFDGPAPPNFKSELDFRV